MYHFSFHDTATTEIYTLSLHDALPISHRRPGRRGGRHTVRGDLFRRRFRQRLDQGRILLAGQRLAGLQRLDELADPVDDGEEDRKSTRLNSSHSQISYAVFCLKKKTKY